MSLLLPILYVTATTLLLAWLAGVAIEQRNGLPAARWTIAVLVIGFVVSLLALVQLCRAADWIHRTEHASTAAPSRWDQPDRARASCRPKTPADGARCHRVAVGAALPLPQRAIRPADPVPSGTRGIDQHLGHRAGQRAEHLDRSPPTPLSAARANPPAQGADSSLLTTEATA